jgi:hypothetical protein
MSTPSASDHDDLLASTTAPPSALTRFLWHCAGADGDILRRCPHSERVKYEGIGGMVLSTGVLAFVSGSYALYTVFSPKVDTVLAVARQSVHWPTTLLASAFGAVYALVIFNIDRFMVSSSGKGDGTEAVTLGEIGRAIPRIVMAVIIGLCMSAPLEIRVMQSEIEARLELEQTAYRKELDDKAEQLFDGEKLELERRREALQKRLDDVDARFEAMRKEIDDQVEALNREVQGASGSGKAGEGPAARMMAKNLENKKADVERQKAEEREKLKPVVDEIEATKKAIATNRADLTARKESNERAARHRDGLAERIRLGHEVSPGISLLLALLLLSIECGPIFFKMMIAAGPYQALSDNLKLVVMAREGIEHRVFIDETGLERHGDVFHGAHFRIAEERRRLKTESELAERVHERYREKMEGEIDRAPEAFFESPKAGGGGGDAR